MKKHKKEFAIVFHSCHKNLETVVFEFNKFCFGEHPCYSGKNNLPLSRFDGTKGSKNFSISDRQ